MNKKATFSTKKIVLVGLMAALTVIGSYFRIKVPADITGTSAFHLGNIMCALSGILLGPWLGGLAAGLGSAIFDIFDPTYLPECWITFLTKGAYGVVSGLVIRMGTKEWGYGKALLAAISGALTYAVLYLAKSFFWSGMLMHSLSPAAAWVNVVSKFPATTFNAVVAIVAAPLLAITIQTALKKNHLTLD